MVNMVKISHLSKCVVWYKIALRRYGPNGQDLHSKNPTDNLWDSHGPNGQDVQSKNVTESLWDSHGQNGQDFPSEKVWGLP